MKVDCIKRIKQNKKMIDDLQFYYISYTGTDAVY